MARNRRSCIRCTLPGIPLDPSPGGETLDLCECGLGWLGAEPLVPGDSVVLDAPAFFQALAIPAAQLTLSVCDLEENGDGRFRIGGTWVLPPGPALAALRRAVLKLQRQGEELDSNVVDIVVLPEAPGT